MNLAGCDPSLVLPTRTQTPAIWIRLGVYRDPRVAGTKRVLRPPPLCGADLADQQLTAYYVMRVQYRRFLPRLVLRLLEPRRAA